MVYQDSADQFDGFARSVGAAAAERMASEVFLSLSAAVSDELTERLPDPEAVADFQGNSHLVLAVIAGARDRRKELGLAQHV